MNKIKLWFSNHKILNVIMIATAILAPILYSLSFVKSMWDPYAGAKNLPVAVVNDDKAVKYQGKEFAIGRQTVNQLRKNHSLKWVFVNSKDAKKGLKVLNYYTVVTIPKDFSKNATTVLDKHPKQMQLRYQTNDSLNYLAETMSEVGVKTIDSRIRSQVTKAYADAMFSQLKILGKGMVKAANGAKQISDGTVTLTDGTKQYTAGVSKVNKGVQTLKVSVAPLASGASQLASGSSKLASGISRYTAGVDTVGAGTKNLATNNGKLLNGANKIQSGLGKYTNGVGQLNSGLNTLSGNSGALRNGASQLASASSQFGTLNSGANQVADGVKTFSSDLQSSNIVGQLTSALAMQSQVTSLEKQLTDVKSALNTLQGIDIDNLKSTMDKISTDGAGAWGSTMDVDGAKESVSSDASEIDKLISSDSNMSAATKSKLQEISADLKSQTNTIQNANSGISNFFTGELMPLQDQLSGIMDQMTQLHSQLPAFQKTMENAQSLLSQTDNLLANLSKNKGMLDAMPGKIALLSSATSQIAAGTQKLADSTGSINTLVGGINRYTQGVDTAKNGANKLAQNSGTLVNGFDQLNSGLTRYTAGVNLLNSGVNKLMANNSQLNGGAGQLSSALSGLNQKVPALIDGVNQLAAGTAKLDSKSGQLLDGMKKVNKGSGTLADQLGQGANKVNSTNKKDANAQMFGSPTNLTHKSTSQVPNYGHALAPFAMATGLFIGVLIFTLEFPASRELKNLKQAKNILFNQFKLAVMISLGMVVILNVLMMLTGLQVDHPADLFWITLTYTLSQMAIMQLFTLGLGRFGTILGLLLFVASIGAAGGMFPMQVTAPIFNTLHPLLPMTYAINGLRQAITGGLGANYAVTNSMILLLVAVVFYVLFLLLAIKLVKYKQINLAKQEKIA